MSERLSGYGTYLYNDPKGLGIGEIQIRTGECTLWSPGQVMKILSLQWTVILSTFKRHLHCLEVTFSLQKSYLVESVLRG